MALLMPILSQGEVVFRKPSFLDDQKSFQVTHWESCRLFNLSGVKWAKGGFKVNWRLQSMHVCERAAEKEILLQKFYCLTSFNQKAWDLLEQRIWNFCIVINLKITPETEKRTAMFILNHYIISNIIHLSVNNSLICNLKRTTLDLNQGIWWD